MQINGMGLHLIEKFDNRWKGGNGFFCGSRWWYKIAFPLLPAYYFDVFEIKMAPRSFSAKSGVDGLFSEKTPVVIL